VGYATAILNTTPVLYWRLGETSGTTATDSSSGGHNGTYSGDTLGVAGGVFNDSDKAVTIGASGKVTSTYAVWQAGAVLTVMGLAKRTNTSTFDTLLGGDGAGGSAPSLRLPSGGENVEFKIRDNDGGATSTALWSNAWPGTGVYVHFTCVIDLTAHTAELYINGASKGQVTGLTQTLSTPGNFIAGALSFGNQWTGQLDEITIWTSALSAATIADLSSIALTGKHTPKPITPVTTADSAQAMKRVHAPRLTRAAEVDTARPLIHLKRPTIVAAAEVDAVRPLHVVKRKALTSVGEVDAAGALKAIRRVTLTTVVGADTAPALSHSKRVTLSVATEADVASSVRYAHGRALVPVTEADVAVSLTASHLHTIGAASEVDVAVHLHTKGSGHKPKPPHPTPHDRGTVVAGVRGEARATSDSLVDSG
jgi:hypothetical protein